MLKKPNLKLETDDRPTKDFKTQGNVKGLKAVLEQQCLMNQEQPSTSTGAAVSRKRLLDELEESEKAAKK